MFIVEAAPEPESAPEQEEPVVEETPKRQCGVVEKLVEWLKSFVQDTEE